MGVLAECPDCRRKQSTKNKKCKCGKRMVSAKKQNKIRYWIDYPLPGGKVRRESVASFEGLDAYSIEDAKDALAKRKVQRREKRIFDMLPGTDLTFQELTEWFLDDPEVKGLRSYDGTVITLKAFNKVFGNYIVNSISNRDLKRYQHKRKSQGIKPRSIDKEIGQAQTVVEQGFLNRKIDGEALRSFKSVKKLLVKGTNARKRKVSIEEFFNLIAVVPPHTRDIMIVAYNTGM
jgi:hypothetical protein